MWEFSPANYDAKINLHISFSLRQTWNYNLSIIYFKHIFLKEIYKQSLVAIINSQQLVIFFTCKSAVLVFNLSSNVVCHILAEISQNA